MSVCVTPLIASIGTSLGVDCLYTVNDPREAENAVRSPPVLHIPSSAAKVGDIYRIGKGEFVKVECIENSNSGSRSMR